MADNGREKNKEELNITGNPVFDNYVSLFNWRDK